MDQALHDLETARGTADPAGSNAARADIVSALARRPVDATALRHAVWAYVGSERHAGISPGPTIIAVTELVESARIHPVSVSQALLRRVILWCVEAYFGHVEGDVVGRDGDALSDAPVLVHP
jgi:hypothetical protein